MSNVLTICIEEGCIEPAVKKSMCGMHYQRAYWEAKGGRPKGKPRTPEQNEHQRIQAKKRYDQEKATTPDVRARKTKNANLKAAYGITIDDYERQFVSQQGRCAICKEELVDRPCVDHCHATGAVRGLLCQKCNFGLGQFRDNTLYMRAAIAYLDTGGVWNE